MPEILQAARQEYRAHDFQSGPVQLCSGESYTLISTRLSRRGQLDSQTSNNPAMLPFSIPLRKGGFTDMNGPSLEKYGPGTLTLKAKLRIGTEKIHERS